MADGKIRVSFEPKGDKELINAIKSLNRETKKLRGINVLTEKSVDGVSKAKGRQNRNAKDLDKTLFGLGGTLSVLRSKMLLGAFAIKQFTDFGGRLIKQANQYNALERSFDQLAFSTDLSADSMQKFSKAANNTISQTDIMTQANNAMLLGIADSTEQMSELFTISHKLAKAVGKDATFGMESLTTGIGRQSRLMLDNLGIIVKAEEAYKKYADELGKSVEDLTVVEQKQAFMNEALDKARDKASLLIAPVNDSSDAYNQLTASLNDAGVVFAQVFTDQVKPAINILRNMSDLMTPERVNAYLTVLKGVGVAMAFYALKTKEAVIWQTRLGWGVIATGIGLATEALIKYTDVLDVSNSETEAIIDTTAKYIEELNNLKKVELIKELEGLEKQLKPLNTTIEESANKMQNLGDVEIVSLFPIDETETYNEKFGEVFENIRNGTIGLTEAHELLANTQKEGNFVIDESVGLSAKEKAEIEKKIFAIKELLTILGTSTLSYNELTDAQKKALDLYKKTPEGLSGVIQAQIEWVKNNKEAFESVEQQIAVIKMLENQLASLKDKYEDNASASAKSIGKVLNSLSQLNAASAGSAKVTARLQQASIVANTASAAMAAISPPTGAPTPIGYANMAAVIALGAAQVLEISRAIGDMNKFETGGLIGGRRHSQGGTIIEAERGEFVMSRNAVNTIGVENLNRMNQGQSGGGGSINISINGGMISPDFVENELAESIREAVRRGADFGIS